MCIPPTASDMLREDSPHYAMHITSNNYALALCMPSLVTLHVQTNGNVAVPLKSRTCKQQFSNCMCMYYIESFHVSSQITCVRVTSRLCPFLPTMRGRLEWHVIQRSQNQEPLGTYAFSISTIAVSQFSGGTDRVNLPPRLRVRE